MASFGELNPDALWVRGLVALVGFVLGLTWCAASTVIDWAAWVLVLPSRRPGELAAQLEFAHDPGAPERRLGEPIEVVTSDGVRLAGIWHASEAPRGRTVLVIHGFAEDPRALGARMAALNRHGWDVAAVDARAHGRSGGDRGSFGGREGADLSAWIDRLSATGHLKPGPIAAWGRSMGAAIVTRAAADDLRFAALVLEAPYVDLEVTIARVLGRRSIPLARWFARLIARRASKLAGVSLSRPRPIDLAPRISSPTLVIHGSDDTLIPLAAAERLARAFTPPAHFFEIPGAGHNSIIDVGGSELLDRIATFLDNAVNGRPTGEEVEASASL